MTPLPFGPPRAAKRQADLIHEHFLTMSAEEYFGREIFNDYMVNVADMSWAEASRELATIVDVPVDQRVPLAMVAKRIAGSRQASPTSG